MPHCRTDPSRRSTLALRATLLLPLTLLVLTCAGCSGCNSKPADPLQGEKDIEERNKKLAAEKLKKEPLEIEPLLPLLGQEPSPEAEGELPPEEAKGRLLVKPGHWTTTVQAMKANYEDFVGLSTTSLLDAKGQPVPLQHTNFTFQSTRPVALAKGRMKRLERELFVPEASAVKQIRVELASRDSGRQSIISQPLLQKMPSYQYFLVVLSEEISKYGFLKVTDAVRMPWEEESESAALPHYRVVLADAKQDLPVPSNTLTWTSVAYLVWDEVDPDKLSPQQQLALVDWIHWGGRLIISGPDSLDTLRGSFLDDYLPAENVGPRRLTAAALDEWSAYWSRRDRGQRVPALEPTKPWSGIQLKPKDGATELIGGAELFYELPVGRGTVVISAIQLAERDLINWPGYDSFLNGALLRRPRRIFAEGPYGDARIDWADHRDRRLDAHFSTGLRIFARDSRTQANQWNVEETTQTRFGQIGTVTSTNVDRPGGIGAWSDFNPVSDAARAVLIDAAAVRVPGPGFVIGCLALYLVILVPLNWMVFSTLGRVEWAWIAAPIIALLGTLVIVRQAQLDIGFVRSQTEVALLELQGTLPRGMLSRFTALYSSLSTTYDVTFDNPTSVATPFPAGQQQLRTMDNKIWDVVFENQQKNQLAGLAVSSASTKMVHSEEMVSLAGPLRLGTSSRGHDQLENRTGYDLRDVVMVRRYFDTRGPARYESCWIGELRDGATSVVGLKSIASTSNQVPHLEERQRANSVGRSTQIEVDALLNLAFQFPESEDPQQQRRDEYRVVGLIDQVLPGTEISPAASQINGTTVVLAHLKYGDLPWPQPDVNSRDDVLKNTNSANSFP